MLRVAARRLVKFEFILRDGSRKAVDAPAGISVLKAAHMHGVELEGACEESLACSTCHVIVDHASFARLPPASEAEEDLLDLAPSLTDTSRLGCQVKIDASLEGAVFTLPMSTLNFYVDGHVPQPH
jgi:ferredoxin